MITEGSDTLVFVYGSLKNGFHNHSLLASSEFISIHLTDTNFTLVDLGMFPAVLNQGTTAIQGEIYRINEMTLSELDKLEGYPRYYDRALISTKFGKAWMYILQKNNNYPVVESGIWE